MYVISNGHNYIMKRKGGRICATFVKLTSFPPGTKMDIMHRNLWTKRPSQARVQI